MRNPAVPSLPLLAGWLLVATGAFAAPPRALIGGTLVDGTGRPPIGGAVVVMREGRIACAGIARDCPVPAGSERVDVSGRWLTPGLVDGHVHLSQTGWADGRPDSLDVRDRYPYAAVEAALAEHPERFLSSYLCSGVTAIFDVGGYPWTVRLARRGTGNRAPHLSAAGPLLSTWDFWLNLPAERQFVYLADAAAAASGVEYLKALGADAVKVWDIALEERPAADRAAVVRAAGAAAKAAGLPLIVHATELETAKEAVAAGARLLVHSVGDVRVDEELLASMRAQGTLYCPTLTVRDGYRRLFHAASAATAPAIDDPHHCVDAATRRKVEETAKLADRVAGFDPAASKRRGERSNAIEAENLRRVAAAGIPIVAGTDAGNPLTLHGPAIYAELEAMQAAGMEPMAVVVAATRNGARAMGKEAELGTVEPGKWADLLVLEADPTREVAAFRKLRAVVRAGVVYTVEELAAAVAAGDERARGD